jgi:catechol-2,3-dioxygenase
MNSLLQGIDTVIVRVSNIEHSSQWYQEKLGLSIVWSDEGLRLTVLDTNGPTSLTLWQTDHTIANNKETASYPIFKTPDAAALREELTHRGVRSDAVITGDHVKYFFFYDPDGNVLEACEVIG